MDVEGSRVWFTDLWNYSIIPYMLEAVREGLQVAHAWECALNCNDQAEATERQRWRAGGPGEHTYL